MPEFSATQLAILTLAVIAGIVAGWLLRRRRAVAEKIALNGGWQHQIDAQQSENDRLVAQTASLTQQINQYRASGNDARKRMLELVESLRNANERRDILQRELKEIRGNLERALEQRNTLRSSTESRDVEQKAVASQLHEKDQRIGKLKRELAKWHERIPPLVERYRVRNLEAEQLAVELEQARARIAQLENSSDDNETRIEPVSRVALSGGLDASNDQYEETAQYDLAEIDDQVSGNGNLPDAFSNGMALGDVDGQDADDLKRIKGIGPAIEKTLNELGICRFVQLANLGEFDINRIADRIRGFRNRMRREDWIGQARSLLTEQNLPPA